MAEHNETNFRKIPFSDYFRSRLAFVAQSVRVVVCGTIGRGFEPHQTPEKGWHYCQPFLFCIPLALKLEIMEG